MSTGSWSTDALSEARHALAATSVGDKAIFAGGGTYSYEKSAVVDIYDTTSGTWSTAALSQVRSSLAATTVDNKAIFAGGVWSSSCWATVFSDVVDMYDASTNTWSIATLSQARAGIAATTVGSKVLFAGGSYSYAPYQSAFSSNVVDIYDATTDTWSTTTLPVACSSMAGTSVGNKAIFAGGVTDNGTTIVDIVQIYDVDTDTWSISALSEERIGLAATTLDNKAIFAGGRQRWPNSSSAVDIYDVESDTWTTTTLSEARYNLTETTVDNMALFAGGEGGGGYETYSNVDMYQVPEPGDANGDGIVDDLDLTILATHWHQQGGWADGDFTGNGLISDADLAILANCWPNGPGPDIWGTRSGGHVSVVPEPATLTLLVLGGLALLRRRRKGEPGK